MHHEIAFNYKLKILSQSFQFSEQNDDGIQRDLILQTMKMK
jgi:hypothetical protein